MPQLLQQGKGRRFDEDMQEESKKEERTSTQHRQNAPHLSASKATTAGDNVK
ncbi:MAG: hypothetical protein J6V13_01635 [Paludibacteraceae bacterium]|nr:hypothetical protein [Paludibacteraceae bacterium]MBO7233675.1 hypothetical protein [Paludibacteraceae bacterium]